MGIARRTGAHEVFLVMASVSNGVDSGGVSLRSSRDSTATVARPPGHARKDPWAAPCVSVLGAVPGAVRRRSAGTSRANGNADRALALGDQCGPKVLSLEI